MHGKYQRRRPHAERDFLQIRQTFAASADGGGSLDDSGAFPGPVTITIIQTIPIATSLSSTEWTTATSLMTMQVSPTISTIQGIPTISSQASSTASSDTTSATTSTSSTSTSTSSTFTPLSSTVPPSATPTTMLTSTSPTAQARLSRSSTSLSAGGIAGILISILVLLAVVLIIFLRKRFIQKRKYVTGAWARRSAAIGPIGPFGSTFGGYNEPKSFNFTESVSNANNDPLSPSFAPDQGKLGNLIVRNIAPGDIAPPPMALNSPVTTSVAPIPLALAPSVATVICTFITTLPDELAITIGETIRILAEYDDGWVLGMNANGEQGMVPLECLDRGAAARNAGLQGDTRSSRRFSSLDANAAGALAAYRK